MKYEISKFFSDQVKGRREREFQKHLKRIRAHESEWLDGETEWDGSAKFKKREKELAAPVEIMYTKMYQQERFVGYKIDAGSPVYLRAGGKAWFRGKKSLRWDNEKKVTREDFPPDIFDLPVYVEANAKRRLEK